MNLEERHFLRQKRLLNAPLGVFGGWLREVSAAGKEIHSLYCQCPDCWKPATDADRARWAERWKQDGHGEPETAPERVVTVLPSQPVPKRSRKAWRGRGRSGN
jgi:hypothetical protein